MPYNFICLKQSLTARYGNGLSIVTQKYRLYVPLSGTFIPEALRLQE